MNNENKITSLAYQLPTIIIQLIFLFLNIFLNLFLLLDIKLEKYIYNIVVSFGYLLVILLQF